MAVVTLYQTSDGELWAEEIEAQEHERSLSLEQRLELLCKMQATPARHQRAILDFVLQNREDLAEILAGDILQPSPSEATN